MGVRPKSKAATTDARVGRDGGRFGHRQADAADRVLTQMHQVPITRNAIVRAVLSHRGQHDAIGQRDIAEYKLGE